MKNKSYFLEKNKKSKDLVYLDYDNLEGYCIKPKITEDGAIEVDQIKFVSKDFSEKLIKKKISKKIQELLDFLNSDDSSSSSNIEKSLMDAERLRMNIIQKYVKYLGNTYQKLTLEKLQIIINELRFKLFSYNLYTDREIEYEENKGRGR